MYIAPQLRKTRSRPGRRTYNRDLKHHTSCQLTSRQNRRVVFGGGVGDEVGGDGAQSDRDSAMVTPGCRHFVADLSGDVEVSWLGRALRRAEHEAGFGDGVDLL